MKKRYTATKEEIKWIKEVIKKILDLDTNNTISSSLRHREIKSETSMSPETFFKILERELRE